MTEYKQNKNKAEEDFISKSIGQFGIWQTLIVFMSSITRLLTSWSLVSIFLLTPRSTFICIEFGNNTTVLDIEPSVCYSDCIKYEFENDIFEETLTTEFELICDKRWLASFTQSILMMGVVFGTNFLGWVADRYGRRNGLLLSIVFLVSFSIGASFAPSYWWFSSFRFIVGVAAGGILVITTIITVETIGPKYRHLGGLLFLSDFIGQATIVIFGYYANTWRQMLFSSSVVSLIFLSYFFLMPETPRWLILVGRTDEATNILTKAAKWNRLNTEQIPKNVEAMRSELQNVSNNISRKYGFADLFISKKLRLRAVLGICIWFILGLCHYGLNQYISLIGQNIYMNVAFAGLAQLWVPVSSLWLNKYIPRRIVIMTSFVINAVLMVILTFVPKDHWTSSAIGILGLCLAALAFSTSYLFVSEMFPTPVRNMGLGICNASSKVGSSLAPFVADVQPVWIPSMLFAVLALVGTLLCYPLPETNGKKLEDSIET